MQHGRRCIFQQSKLPHGKKIVTIPDYLYSYRVDNNDSLTHTVRGEKDLLQRINNFNETGKFYKSKGYFKNDSIRVSSLKDAISFYNKDMSADALKKLADSLGETELVNFRTIKLISDEEKQTLFRIRKPSCKIKVRV